MRTHDQQSRMMIIVVGFVTIAGVVGAVFGDVGKAVVVAVGMVVFLVVGIVLALRERNDRGA
jgi:hypothetical protein